MRSNWPRPERTVKSEGSPRPASNGLVASMAAVAGLAGATRQRGLKRILAGRRCALLVDPCDSVHSRMKTRLADL
jgi:hypothetical protein